MKINKDYRLESDELNVTLYKRGVYKKGEHTGEEFWTAVGFWGTPEAALKGMVNLEIKGTGMTDLETVVNKINELAYEISKTKKL